MKSSSRALYSAHGVAFVAALLFVTVLPAARALNTIKSETFVYDYEATRVRANLSPEVEYAPGVGVKLAWMPTRRSGYFRKGVITSPLRKAPFAFNEVILSWNLDLPEGTGAVIEVRALGDNCEATPWYEMARIGKVPASLERYRHDAEGSIGGCGFGVTKRREWAQYRVTLYTSMPHRTPTLRLMAMIYSDDTQPIAYVPETIPKEPQPWMRSLPVRWRSQMVEDRSISWRTCGPTSLSMAMEYNGRNLPTADVDAAAWDDYGRMFGNWAFMAQGAAKYGLKSWVYRCRDFKPIEAEIAAGRPVVISVQFKEGELNNGPFKATDGHLILCVGFTRNGDLICNDPGTRRKQFDHVVYKRSEIATAWLSHAAAAICVLPRAK